ncbi:MAG: DUF4491 family protein [Paludibacteraceae bacterium]|jgi:hypothetical protein|nr:DUF4491 family protein [Paludibacteraceae bacterium]
MNFTGIIIGSAVFLMIGIFHPIVIKAEYYWGTGCWPVFAIVGLAAIVGSLFVESVIVSVLLGAFAFSSFWSIHELFEQKKRVERGWFPRNPNRK